ncbi:FecR family protein [Marinifilum sp. RC60d5]|uniref:FecR family protein n=1 Tax=Marinifilum sp. RC60d5 TaxID=3458414 RepID=UPI004035966B
MKEKKQHINEQILVSILNQKASEDELKTFQKWMNANPENKESFKKMQKIWEKSKKIEVFNQIDVEADWKSVKAKSNSSVTTRKLSVFMRYAASIIILLSLSYIFLYQTTPGFGKLAQQKTEMQKEEVLLADGTQVYLNKKSKLVYPNQFDSKIRNVKLEGEAYFQVKKNPSKPFIITSGNAIIKVLGTAFNVRNDENGRTIVTVNSGKVSLTNQKTKKLVYLTKGEKGIIHDSVISESVNDEANFDAWKTGVLRFRKTPLPLVLKYIENYYGIKITNKCERINTLNFNSTFNNEGIDNVITELELQLNVKTVKRGKHLIISERTN